MKDDKITQLATAFQEKWNYLFRDYSKYQLDFSWPTVGTVDLLLTPLRFRETLTEKENELLLGSAAYISSIAHDCWTKFPGSPKVELTYTEEPEVEMELSTSGGLYLEGDNTFSVKILSSIKNILKDPPNPLPFFDKTKRIIMPDHNFLSLFTIGLCSGLCPYGKGLFLKKKDEDTLKNLFAVALHLAQGASSYYSKVFPTEPLGASIEIYRDFLILPPAGHREPFPAIRGAAFLAKYFANKSVPEDEMLATAINLSLSPDEGISSIGYSLAAALSDKEIPDQLKLRGESLGNYRAHLRPAVITARMELGKPANWLSDMREGKFESAIAIAQNERELGLMPLLKLPLKYIENLELEDVLHMLAWSRAEDAKAALHAYSQSKPLSIDMVLQEVFIDIVLGDYESASSGLSALVDIPTPGDPYQNNLLLTMRGLLAERKEDFDEAITHYEKAFREATHNLEDYVSNGLALSRVLLAATRVEDALIVINSILRQTSCSAAAHANKTLVLRLLNREEEMDEALMTYIKLCPMDRAAILLLAERLQHQNGAHTKENA